MRLRYALVALALLAALPAPSAHAQDNWRYTRKITFPLTGADTVKIRPFLNAVSANGTLYVITSRSTDTLAVNALWKAAPGATQMTLVADFTGDPDVNSTRGVTTIGNDVLVSVNPRTAQVGGIYHYKNGDAAQRTVFNSAVGKAGYGTYPTALSGTASGYVYAVVTAQTSMRVYNFSDPAASNWGSWVGMTPFNRTEVAGHDGCALSQMRDIATIPGRDYTTNASVPFFSSRNTTANSAPETCTRIQGGIAAWTGGTAVAPGPTVGTGYASERLADPAGDLALSSYVASGITADRAGRVWVAGPDSVRRWVKYFDVAGTFAIEAGALPALNQGATGGAPFRAPNDVALSADEKMAYVIDRDARAVWVFQNGTTANEANEAPTGFLLDGASPNPVRGAATVRYRLAAATEVRLALYDALGREVALLASGVQPAGEASAPLDASRLAAGVYTVRLAAGGHVATRLLVVAQ